MKDLSPSWLYRLQRRKAQTEFRLSTRTRRMVYRKLANMLRQRALLTEVLEAIYQNVSERGRKPNTAAAVAVGEWLRGVRDESLSLAQAVQGWVPAGEALLIQAGEHSNTLPDTLLHAIRIRQAQRRLITALRAMVSYPGLLVLAVMGLLYAVAMVVVPAFEELVPRAEWAAHARAVALVAEFAASGGFFVIFGVVAVLLGVIVATFGSWTGSLRTRLDRFPPWSWYRLFAGSSFLASVAVLYAARMGMFNLLTLLAQSANPWLRERIEAAAAHVHEGANLGEALAAAGHGFPDPSIIVDLEFYSGLQNFDAIVLEVTLETMEEATERLTARAARVRSWLILTVALCLATVGAMIADVLPRALDAMRYAT